MAQPSQAEILAALAAQSALPRTTPTLSFSTISAPLAQLTNPISSSTAPKTNSRKIYCPRDGCGSVVLQPGSAEWVQVDGPVLPIDPASPFPAPSPPHALWLVPEGPFAFDNIGFSRPAPGTVLPPHAPLGQGESGKGKAVKWLICADCDLGPIGWSYEGGTEAWLAVDRVRYGEAKKLLE